MAPKVFDHRRERDLRLDDMGATSFFQLVSARYEHMLTSNKSCGEWSSIMGDQIIPTAILDRSAASLPDHQHPRRALSIEAPAEGRFVSSAKRRRRATGSLSFAGKLAERSLPSRLRCAAQNPRGLDCSGPFRGHLTYMKEREPPNFTRADAAPSRWSALDHSGWGFFEPELFSS